MFLIYFKPRDKRAKTKAQLSPVKVKGYTAMRVASLENLDKVVIPKDSRPLAGDVDGCKEVSEFLTLEEAQARKFEGFTLNYRIDGNPFQLFFLASETAAAFTMADEYAARYDNVYVWAGEIIYRPTCRRGLRRVG